VPVGELSSLCARHLLSALALSSDRLAIVAATRRVFGQSFHFRTIQVRPKDFSAALR
jgi:hypothetical protein